MKKKYKEVFFEKWCNQCQYQKERETSDPCNECLTNPVNESSHRPVLFKKKKQRRFASKTYLIIGGDKMKTVLMYLCDLTTGVLITTCVYLLLILGATIEELEESKNTKEEDQAQCLFLFVNQKMEESKMNVKGLLDTALIFGKKNLPEILTVVSTVGIVTTGVLAFKAGRKSEEIIKEKKQDMEDVDPEDREAKRTVMWETVKEVTPIVVPPIILGTITIACVFGSNRVSNKRIVALSAAYSLSESALKDLNQKIEDIVGEKKAKDIKDALAKDKVMRAEDEEKDRIILPGDGDILCLDDYSRRFFRSNYQKVQSAINQLTYMCMTEMYVSLNDFYELLGIEATPMGDDFGWNVDDFSGGTGPFTITTVLDKNGIPALAITYDVKLRDDYKNLH